MPGEIKFAIERLEEKFAQGILAIKAANVGIHNEMIIAMFTELVSARSCVRRLCIIV